MSLFPRKWVLPIFMLSFWRCVAFLLRSKLKAPKLLTCITRPVCILFSRWFAHLCSGLGRGPDTPPGPAMVLMDRKDLNTAKNRLICIEMSLIVTSYASDASGRCLGGERCPLSLMEKDGPWWHLQMLCSRLDRHSSKSVGPARSPDYFSISRSVLYLTGGHPKSRQHFEVTFLQY